MFPNEPSLSIPSFDQQGKNISITFIRRNNSIYSGDKILDRPFYYSFHHVDCQTMRIDEIIDASLHPYLTTERVHRSKSISYKEKIKTTKLTMNNHHR